MANILAIFAILSLIVASFASINIPSMSLTVQPLAQISNTTTIAGRTYNVSATAVTSTTTVPPNFFGNDLGTLKKGFNTNGLFSMQNIYNHNLTISPLNITDAGHATPTVLNSTNVYYNSTTTLYQFTGADTINEYFKTINNGYGYDISIQGNLISVGSVSVKLSCLSGTLTNSSSSVSCGYESFQWDSSFNPVYNNITHVLKWSIPNNQPFNIDPLALDGSGNCINSSTNSCTISLTTARANDVIIVFTNSNPANTYNALTPKDTSGLTWQNRTQSYDTPWTGLNEYFAIQPTATTDTITCRSNNLNQQMVCIAFGISGANLTTTFDNNHTIPQDTNNNGTASTHPLVKLSTSQKGDFVFTAEANFCNGACPTATVPSGFTSIASISHTNYLMSVAYEIFNSAQSSISAQWTLSVTNRWAVIGDAVTNASISSSTTTVTGTTTTFTNTTTTSITTATGVVIPEPAGSTDFLLILLAIIIFLILMIVGTVRRNPFPTFLGATVLLIMNVGLYTNNKIVYGSNIITTPLWVNEMITLLVVFAFVLCIYQMAKRR